ncbi:Bacteriophage Mu, Gp36 [uncultured Caudovirales phage]|uniref:Bacteriophage Mu, Gp36 n=1 Tax=uncultured Caudovirales phage TaxID=2100421 RepID=A0A6J5KY62_9CAUD|nr:Bacteriophage Mu, Gp36 [uncultured Caudovirales phage]CAB5170720.1 Bacteriophage Mu, Gp36 [uncultured Caudovirales phage]
MAYLIPSDYLRLIQDANLSQIITSNSVVQSGAELAAQAEAISYLRQKYDVKSEFGNTSKWNKTSPYSAGNRVYLDADNYLPSKSYSIGEVMLYQGKVYQCIIATTGTLNLTSWDVLGNQYDLYYALNPFPMFDLTKLYNKGDKVFWLGAVYTCLVQTPVLSHEDGIQYYQTNQIPYANIFPNDPVQGSQKWQWEYNYLIDGGSDIKDESIWSSSDNRDQQMVMFFTDITLYHLHARIAPRNIPDLRVARYEAAIDWLKMCAKGDITPNLPLLQPKQGARIRFGGQVRNINSY